jgi:hypothetical protein
MPGVVLCNPPGYKLGNATMSWLHAYAHAQRVGAEFQCPPWIGEQVFHLPEYRRPDGKERPRRSEIELKPDETDVEIRGYAQNQAAMIYTKKWAQSVLTLKRHSAEVFTDESLRWMLDDELIAHRRVGDYIGYGYPIVSEASIQKCWSDNFNPPWRMTILTEEKPTPGRLPNDLSMLPDFYRMVRAPNLIRGNSSFSWLAALLSYGRVFSPVVKGLAGGREHDVEFVEGNWPALSDLACGSDMHLKEE